MTTLAEAQTRLAEYMAAESACLAGQEVRLTSANGIDRTEILPDLREIRKGLAHWRGQVAVLQARANGQGTFAGMTYSSANFGNLDNTGR